ncbi:hypothetical protein HYT51_02760 [Candidatus Woesearchaeota archaeon]|nr:hypothetical protein [Candidatus Woesearchaeota archaeon]
MQGRKSKINDIERWMEAVDKKLDNHLVHSAADIAQIKNDLDWVKRFFWLVAGTSITAILGTMIGLIFKF